jgi:hypothetical protein
MFISVFAQCVRVYYLLLCALWLDLSEIDWMKNARGLFISDELALGLTRAAVSLH